MAAYAGKHGENVVANIIAEAQGSKAGLVVLWYCMYFVQYTRLICANHSSQPMKCCIIIISDEGLQDSFRWNVGTCGEI
jgi:hypothetical protein